MSIEDAVISRLRGFAGVSALVGTRIYSVKLPQNVVYPAVLVTKVSGPREHAMGVDPGIARPRFQVAAWSPSYDTAKTLAIQLQAALSRWNGTEASVVVQDSQFENEVDLYEPEADVYHIPLDFIITHRE